MEKKLLNELGNEVLGLVEGDFIFCVLNIEANDGSIEYHGFYTDNRNQKHDLKVSKINVDLTFKLIDWYDFSNESGDYKWNKILFKIDSKHKMEVNYLWDQELADELDLLG